MTHYYVIKDGRMHSDFDNYEQAKALADIIDGEVASDVLVDYMKCVSCQYWTMAFDNSCCHPDSPRFEKYVPSDTEICEYFEEEKL